jgi:hypothetical protein
MKRAVIIFLENKNELLLQFGCLYTSYQYIEAKDTDLIVYGPKDVLHLLPDDCIKVEYSPGESNYPFIHSISHIVYGENAFLNKYDYILRTDVDTFLTPAWNSFFPSGFTVGRGYYALNQDVEKKILHTANALRLTHKGIHNIGTSHYGPPQLIRNVCELSVYVAAYLLSTDFSSNEGKWPGWYKGVTTMYSNEIAINHLIDALQIYPEEIDFDSTSADTILKHPHIHCWHTDRPFSKFEFAFGNYNHLAIDKLNINCIKDYCIYISLKALQETAFLKGL